MPNQDQKPPENLSREEIVPERPLKPARPFSEKSAEKIPAIPKMTRFGEPEDLIPKKPERGGLPGASLGGKPEGPRKDEYEGPSVEELERKGRIKKIIFGIIILSFLVFGGIFAYNKWIKKPETKEIKPTIESTETKNTDIDGDGMPNDWEEKHGLNPEDPRDALLDPDFDKLINLDEYKYGTDPNNPDTDNDGYKDGEEVKAGYNPTGPGKLEKNSNNETAKSFPTMKGTWEGTLLGATYKSSVLNLTLQSNGNVAGKLIADILTLDDSTMESELSGTFDYKKEAGKFSADINGDASYKGKGKKILVRGNHKLVLEGKVRNNESEIAGTWTLDPGEELFWLKQDRGNFSLRKTSEFTSTY
jgi:hypothetical protein